MLIPNSTRPAMFGIPRGVPAVAGVAGALPPDPRPFLWRRGGRRTERRGRVGSRPDGWAGGVAGSLIASTGRAPDGYPGTSRPRKTRTAPVVVTVRRRVLPGRENPGSDVRRPPDGGDQLSPTPGVYDDATRHNGQPAAGP